MSRGWGTKLNDIWRLFSSSKLACFMGYEQIRLFANQIRSTEREQITCSNQMNVKILKKIPGLLNIQSNVTITSYMVCNSNKSYFSIVCAHQR